MPFQLLCELASEEGRLNAPRRWLDHRNAGKIALQPGMNLAYSDRFEYLERANERLKLVVPAMLLIIAVMLYLTFRPIDEAPLILGTLR